MDQGKISLLFREEGTCYIVGNINVSNTSIFVLFSGLVLVTTLRLSWKTRIGIISTILLFWRLSRKRLRKAKLTFFSTFRGNSRPPKCHDNCSFKFCKTINIKTIYWILSITAYISSFIFVKFLNAKFVFYLMQGIYLSTQFQHSNM